LNDKGHKQASALRQRKPGKQGATPQAECPKNEKEQEALTTNHKHRWYIDLAGIQFLQCECGAIQTVDIQRKKVYIAIVNDEEK